MQVIKSILLILFVIIFSNANVFSQNETTKLFSNSDALSMKLSYSNKNMKRKTNDSTYIDTDLFYKSEDGSWVNFPVSLRARGNFRRATCYFPPIKMKIKKSNSNSTLFEGNKKLKLVLPCKIEKDLNDNILKELIAYKLYEHISPYHFKTRMVNIEFREVKGKKFKDHQLKGFLIEDDKKVAKLHDGKVFERFIHPLAMDAETSIQNALFQFMIGNTDFSVAYQHNGKLLYIDKKIMPLPYDFDMSGLVNASYSVPNETLGINSVTQRVFRGFKRDDSEVQKIRQQFLDKKASILETVKSFEGDFDNPKEYSEALSYIESFFTIIESDANFKSKVLMKARTK
ncbi:MAG: hypothetical protein P8M03_00640 [Flavobacteriaceae bacterium]|nr:hypothetical protein [Flavobacteriaceae bacterium]